MTSFLCYFYVTSTLLLMLNLKMLRNSFTFFKQISREGTLRNLIVLVTFHNDGQFYFIRYKQLRTNFNDNSQVNDIRRARVNYQWWKRFLIRNVKCFLNLILKVIDSTHWSWWSDSKEAARNQLILTKRCWGQWEPVQGAEVEERMTLWERFVWSWRTWGWRGAGALEAGHGLATLRLSSWNVWQTLGELNDTRCQPRFCMQYSTKLARKWKHINLGKFWSQEDLLSYFS